jgi:hypothetical protein
MFQVPHEDPTQESTQEVTQLVLEYGELAIRFQLTTEEADRLGEILELATSSEALSFWITEVDHIIGHLCNVLGADDRETYKDFQSLLKEYQGGKIRPVPLSFPEFTGYQTRINYCQF